MSEYYLDTGQSVEGDEGWYRVNREVGEGGNCVVYLVTQTGGKYRGNNFALKIFRNTWDSTRERRFHDELEFLEEAEHPSILKYYDQGDFRSYPFLISEYLPKTLRDVIEEESVPLTEKLSYATQLLSVLVHLENENPPVVHRDIKPDNIFIRSGTCYLGDFGLMKRMNENDSVDSEGESFYKSEDTAMNKYRYRTPDLVKYERDEIDEIPVQSDVFQLGLVLIELFSENNWNPQIPKSDPLSDVEIDEQAYDWIRIPEGLSNRIGPHLTRMITKDHTERPKASEIMDNWMGLFEDAADMSQNLNGRVF